MEAGAGRIEETGVKRQSEESSLIVARVQTVGATAEGRGDLEITPVMSRNGVDGTLHS